MAYQHLAQRLAGIQAVLKGVHSAGATLSSATRGSEHAAFIDEFLSKVLPPNCRFGDGDATDQDGRRSGQLDVVVEYPWIPSLPVLGATRPRLYLAEGIAAVIEVKSNVSDQWQEVLATAGQLGTLRRKYGSGFTAGWQPTQWVPLFAAGYTGWKNKDALQQHLQDGPIDGILVIDPGLFVSASEFGGVIADGPWALWGLIACVHQATSVLSSIACGVPIRYAV